MTNTDAECQTTLPTAKVSFPSVDMAEFLANDIAGGRECEVTSA